MPRIIHRITQDPGVLVLAAEAVAGAVAFQPGISLEQRQGQGRRNQPGARNEAPHESGGSGLGSIDGVICGERRGDAMWLYGLRVREGTRGRGLGHLLMEAMIRMAPELLARAPDARPPPPWTSARPVPHPEVPPPASSSLLAQPAATTALTPVAVPPPPGTPEAASPGSASGAGSFLTQPIRQIITCTVTYNFAAQRIIGRQLPGPLYEIEVWPGQQLMEAYEAAVGWERGVGLPPGVPCLLDWVPGVRQVLDADTAAQELLPRWRRVSGDPELRSAVAHLLYDKRWGNAVDGHESATEGGAADGGFQDASSGGAAVEASVRTTLGSLQECQELLWLPMPYDVWPLESEFVQRELAAGNIWVLTEPPAEVAALSQSENEESLNGGRSSRKGAGRGAGGMEEQDGPVVGIMLLTHFETLSRVCTGILARNNAAVHAAIVHAGQLQPHFWVSTLRIAAGCKQASPVPGIVNGGQTEVKGRTERDELAEPLPALYGVAGGHRGVLVYGSVAAPPAPATPRL
ncbi:hypothetical protein VaNZ11_011864 [Volvox africanus]|uniref:N-acetyltransferase domain-containing protein n=1 Tax=Volvox africanus TaxID=51714 RepID=A0ABQ5SCE9_9CHLO|nr:hypothetical protein VaNZ11_011864 [Volvox africanus]